MGRAFTEDEKDEIRKRLLEAGLEMCHDSSVKTISIRELTSRAGISQGGFYTFYEDKDRFVLDVMRYRSEQKIRMIESTFESSLASPSAYLSDMMYSYLIDMKHKTDSRELYDDIFKIFMKNPENAVQAVQIVFRGLIEKLVDFWSEKKREVVTDIDGVCSVMAGAFMLFYHSDMIPADYFADIFRTYIESNTKNYVVEAYV